MSGADHGHGPVVLSTNLADRLLARPRTRVPDSNLSSVPYGASRNRLYIVDDTKGLSFDKFSLPGSRSFRVVLTCFFILCSIGESTVQSGRCSRGDANTFAIWINRRSRRRRSNKRREGSRRTDQVRDCRSGRESGTVGLELAQGQERVRQAEYHSRFD